MDNINDSETISADISDSEVKRLIEENYDILPENISKLDGYYDLNYRISPPIKMKTNNGYTQISPHGYILKIINWKDSMNVGFVTEYINILVHLRKQQLPCPYPIKTNKGEYKFNWSKRKYDLVDDGNPQKINKPLQRVHTVLLLEFLTGELLEGKQFGERFCFSLGGLVNKLHTALKPFCGSKALQRPHFLLSLTFAPDVLKYASVIEQYDKRTMAIQTIDEFQENVLDRMDELEQGIIHGDLNKSNILIPNSNEHDEISGIIDFCDVSHSCYLFEIAIAITYLSLDDTDRLNDIAAAFILGYGKQLTELEFNSLKICICTRLSQSLILGLYSYKLHPTNTYLLQSQEHGWPLLQKLRNTANTDFVADIKEKIFQYRAQF